MSEREIILKVRDLETKFTTDDGDVTVLHGVSFDVRAGRTLGLVGESGCGKSVTSMSILGLLPQPYGQVTKGQVIYRGTDLLSLPPGRMSSMRGNNISIIFQDPMTALNPVQNIRQQLEEVLILHRPELKKAQRHEYCLRMLAKVRIPEPKSGSGSIRITCRGG